MDLRKVEILVGNKWEEIRLQDVKSGQPFRMFEDGVQLLHNGVNTFVAESDGFVENGVATINTR